MSTQLIVPLPTPLTHDGVRLRSALRGARVPLRWSAVVLLAGGCFVDSGYPASDYQETGTEWYGSGAGGGQGHTNGGGGSNNGGSSGSGGSSSAVCTAQESVGSCDGDQLLYCDKGTSFTIDCAASNKVCAFDPTNEWYDCLAPATVVSDDCGAVTEEGVCDGQDLLYCSDGQLLGATCAEHGGVCGWVASKSWFDCVSVGSRKPPTPGTCAGVSTQGSCTGDALAVCSAGVVEVTDCSASGGTCVVDSSGTASCAAPAPGGSCGQIDSAGECQGDTVVWCDGNSLASLDCGGGGRVCGWNDAQKFYDCVDEVSVTPCGDVDEAGVCDGDLLSYCQGGELVSQVCDYGCGWSESASYYDCATEPPPPGEACGDIDAVGVCEGTTLSYCTGDALVVDHCVYGCGFNATSGLSECLPEPLDPCAGIDALGICDLDTLFYCQAETLVQESCDFGCTVSQDDVAQCLPDPLACGDIDATGACEGATLLYCQDATLVSQTCALACGYDEVAGLFTCI